MVTKRTATRLAAHERRYRDLARQLSDIGYIASGSVAAHFNCCGKPNCACHADPPQLHGPTGNGPPKLTAKPSIGDSTNAKPTSTRNGSPTTAKPEPYSPRCDKPPPKQPNYSSTKPPPTPTRSNLELRLFAYWHMLPRTNNRPVGAG